MSETKRRFRIFFSPKKRDGIDPQALVYDASTKNNALELLATHAVEVKPGDALISHDEMQVLTKHLHGIVNVATIIRKDVLCRGDQKHETNQIFAIGHGLNQIIQTLGLQDQVKIPQLD